MSSRPLSESEIKAIQAEYKKGVSGRGCAALARKHGLSNGAVWRVVNGVKRTRKAGYALQQDRPSRTDAFVLVDGQHPYALGQDGHVLTPDEIKTVRETFVRLQGGKCPICSAPPEDGIFHLDHDARTGRPRGALCQGHNRGLGLFYHDLNTLRRALAYLGAATDDWYEDHDSRLASALALMR